MLQEVVPFFSCVATPDSFEDAAQKYQEIYVANPDGSVLKHVKLPHDRYVRLEVDKVPKAVKDALPVPVGVSPGLNFLPAGKIPYEFFEQIVKFFRDVIKLKKAQFEAHAWILWSPERGYFISIPKQTVSAASVNFTYSHDDLPPGSTIVVDIHSHNSMGAFYSGTDNNNDKTGIYYSGVVGKLTDKSFDVVMRFNLFEDKLDCKLLDVFQEPQKEEIATPQEWLDKVEVSTPPTYQGGLYSGHSYQGGRGNSHHNRFQGPAHQGMGFIPQGTNSNGKPYDYSKKNRKGGENLPSLWEEKGVNIVEANRRLELATKEYESSKNPGQFTLDGSDIIDTLTGNVVDGEVVGGQVMSSGEPRGSLRQSSDSQGNQTPTSAASSSGTESEGLEVISESELTDGADEYAYYAAQYGLEVSDAKEEIDVTLGELDGCDEALTDVIRQAYALLTESGKADLARDGL